MRGKQGLFVAAVMLFATMGASLFRMGNREPRGSSSGRFTGDFRKVHLKRIKYARARG